MLFFKSNCISLERKARMLPAFRPLFYFQYKFHAPAYFFSPPKDDNCKTLWFSLFFLSLRTTNLIPKKNCCDITSFTASLRSGFFLQPLYARSTGLENYDPSKHPVRTDHRCRKTLDTYELLDVLNFCWIIDVFLCGTDSGVGIASPVGNTPVGFGFAADFCFAIW